MTTTVVTAPMRSIARTTFAPRTSSSALPDTASPWTESATADETARGNHPARADKADHFNDIAQNADDQFRAKELQSSC